MGEKAVISDEQHLKRWPPPSWIYYFFDSGHMIYFQ